jgi:hypothetical protein
MKRAASKPQAITPSTIKSSESTERQHPQRFQLAPPLKKAASKNNEGGKADDGVPLPTKKAEEGDVVTVFPMTP